MKKILIAMFCFLFLLVGCKKAETFESVSESVLSGKRIVFLGSSVTYGYASGGVSFADLLDQRNGLGLMYKEAVSGTTLVDEDESSYVSRMKSIPVKEADLMVVQLSTNDASRGKDLGEVSESFEMADFDVRTIAGAIETIISYAQNTWNCPVVFYTSPRYDSVHYQKMVDLLLKIADKWEIGVVDMWNDADFNNISSKAYRSYMSDAIHPTLEGYKEWWTPYFEKYLCDYLKDQ